MLLIVATTFKDKKEDATVYESEDDTEDLLTEWPISAATTTSAIPASFTDGTGIGVVSKVNLINIDRDIKYPIYKRGNFIF